MSDKKRGLYGKFIIERMDGSSAPGKKHEACDYFVLDLTHDPCAWPALRAYAEACRAEYPLLAADLDAKLPADPALEGLDLKPFVSKVSEEEARIVDREAETEFRRQQDRIEDRRMVPSPDIRIGAPAPARETFGEWHDRECPAMVEGRGIASAKPDWPFSACPGGIPWRFFAWMNEVAKSNQHARLRLDDSWISRYIYGAGYLPRFEGKTCREVFAVTHGCVASASAREPFEAWHKRECPTTKMGGPGDPVETCADVEARDGPPGLVDQPWARPGLSFFGTDPDPYDKVPAKFKGKSCKQVYESEGATGPGAKDVRP